MKNDSFEAFPTTDIGPHPNAPLLRPHCGLFKCTLTTGYQLLAIIHWLLAMDLISAVKLTSFSNTPSLDRIKLCKTFITPKFLGKKSPNFQWMFVKCCGFVMLNVNGEVLIGGSMQNNKRNYYFNSHIHFLRNGSVQQLSLSACHF